jgi:hypothetical protein
VFTVSVRPLAQQSGEAALPSRATAAATPAADPLTGPAPVVREPSAPPQPVAAATAQASSPPPPDPVYLPRGQLTVAPKLLSEVDLPFPPDVEGIVDLKVKVTLFIDEEGAVQRVRVDTPNVHPSFERVLRDSFAAARFSPGELNQARVRSQLRLEADFQAPSAVSGGSRRPPS